MILLLRACASTGVQNERNTTCEDRTSTVLVRVRTRTSTRTVNWCFLFSKKEDV